MSFVWDIASLIVQGAVTFVASTFIFDVVHFMLHKWARSPIKVLRVFSSWHHVHHKFLDVHMNINPKWVKANFWAHLVPEFLTSVAGTVVFYLVFHWLPVSVILGIHVWMFVGRFKEEGIDYNHMAMDRLSGQVSLWNVNPSYHALHHVYPDNFYSSYVNLFDLIFGTSCKIRKRRFVVTGASGAYGKAMIARLKDKGAIVETAKSDVDYGPADYERMREKLQRADVLVLAHGSKSADAWNANFRTPVDLIDMFIEIGKGRLTPPEVWGLGSEAELHGDLGMDSLKAYAASKRAFASRALDYYLSDDVLYRHIVPSAFTSGMGKGLMSAETAVTISMFFIRRGFKYIPVTFTTLAFWNYFRFRLQDRGESTVPRWSLRTSLKKLLRAATGGQRDR